ncbi:unnamed protein product [Eruca vesicaria subsp. sativa]|uniref:Uncharacterized protein n=1 Tax=Eruca vesicaria subsp. sativa TaxID=29727 RepID=A0ABC8LNG2_ERUVS|nr:unnamed protein product [Eruca vesicaria subsp. sativa]
MRTSQASVHNPGDEPTRITGVKRYINEGCADGDSWKLKFSVSFLREENIKDSTAFVRKKPPKRPKKRQ